MRIGMILDKEFPPDPRVENEAVSLIQSGHEVVLFCIDYSGSLPEVEVVNGIQVRRIFPSKLIYKLSALAYTLPFYSFYLKRKVKKFIEKEKPDIIHLHDLPAARAVFSVTGKMKLKVVFDLHENRPEIMKFYGHVKAFPGKYLIYPERWKKFEFKYIQEADTVITVTKEAASYYQEQLGLSSEKFVVVPNTVRREFYTDFEIDEPIIKRFENFFSLLYVGDTGLRRGLMTVLEAIPSIVDKVPNLCVVIVGKSIDDDKLRSYIKQHQLDAYVSFEGWQNFKTFQSYISSSNLGICPIHKNLHHDTTYANKVFQYMAFGLPVVVSNCDSQEAIVNEYECGLVFKEKNARDFAEKVIKIATNKLMYQTFSNNAKECIESHLNWEKSNQKLIELYKQ